MLLRLNFRIIAVFLLLLLGFPASAQEQSAYAWQEADLALINPAGWDAPVPEADGDTLTLTLSDDVSEIVLSVLPPAADDSALRAALETEIASLDLLPLDYSLDTMYGRSGLHIDAVSADRTLFGIARSGLMPDNRPLLVASRAPAAEREAFEDTLQLVLDSIVFSASLSPTLPTYHPIWTLPPGEQPVGWVAAGEGRVYVLESVGVQLLTELDGVRALDAATGALINEIPFEDPANPTGIAVDATGIVYVGDTVCRCVRRMSPEGEWLEPVGSFGGNAPYNLAVADDGTIYATDKTEEGYTLRILGEPVNQTVGLNFNASAPPLVARDRAGQVWVVEWLNSMIDGAVSGAVSLVDEEKLSAELRFWLEGLTPDSVNTLATSPSGDLVFATSDHGLRFIHASGADAEPLPQETPSASLRALAFDAEGTLFIVQANGALQAFSTRGAPDRAGGRRLALGVPVQGIFAPLTSIPAEDEEPPKQSWTYAGTAGETITISAVDQTRTDAFMLGLDMALRLIAPDGSEVAYNDDQVGDDLFGVYDAQLPDVLLAQSGDYTIIVEQRQGEGTYTLGIGAPRPLDLNSSGVTEVTGHLQDVFPSEHWVFTAQEGDVLTFTMTAVTDGLDPALMLRQPNGELLAFNDDASDPVLGVNAQLTQVQFPLNGSYVLEASRYEGAGEYQLVVVSTAQPV